MKLGLATIAMLTYLGLPNASAVQEQQQNQEAAMKAEGAQEAQDANRFGFGRWGGGFGPRFGGYPGMLYPRMRYGPFYDPYFYGGYPPFYY